MYWVIAIIIIYVLAGLYDERVFAYSVLGVICIVGLLSYIIHDAIDKLCGTRQTKKKLTIKKMYGMLD